MCSSSDPPPADRPERVLDRGQVGAIVDVVAELAERFAAEGHRLYLVGGVVRDLARGTVGPRSDIDLTTDAPPSVSKALTSPLATALWTQGERFGTIGATVNGRDVEITTHRAEVYDPETRNPVVSFGTSIDEDLSRRDFTINAMAVSLPDATLLDPFGGWSDLADGRLRTPLSPSVSFTDDPLRMLRAARFMARFDLEPDPDLVEAATELADRLAIVSVERIHDELERLLAVDDPGPGLTFLDLTGLLPIAVPSLVTESSRRRAIELAGRAGSVAVRRAGLLWPVRDDARSTLDHLRYARADRDRTLALHAGVEQIDAQHTGDEACLGEAVRRTVDRVGLGAMADLEQLVTNLDPDAGTAFFDRYRALAAAEDLGDLDSPLGGSQVMTELGIGPGPAVGRAVRHLKDRRLTAGPLSVEAARVELHRWWAEVGSRPRDGGDREEPGSNRYPGEP